MIESLKQRL